MLKSTAYDFLMRSERLGFFSRLALNYIGIKIDNKLSGNYKKVIDENQKKLSEIKMFPIVDYYLSPKMLNITTTKFSNLSKNRKCD